MSISMPRVFLIFFKVSLIKVSVFKPKKSILMRPTFSMTWPSYWVTTTSSLVSLSLMVATGATLVRSSAPMMTPQAWMPT